jgi:hypothetical protein
MTDQVKNVGTTQFKTVVVDTLVVKLKELALIGKDETINRHILELEKMCASLTELGYLEIIPAINIVLDKLKNKLSKYNLAIAEDQKDAHEFLSSIYKQINKQSNFENF